LPLVSAWAATHYLNNQRANNRFFTKLETPVGRARGGATALLRVCAAPMQKPLEYGPVGDEAALSVASRCQACFPSDSGILPMV
jgi:hypothetical protein